MGLCHSISQLIELVSYWICHSGCAVTCSNLFGLFQLLGNLCFCEDIFVLERLSNASQSMKTLKKLIYLYFAYIASFTGLGSKDSKIKIPGITRFQIHVKYR